MEGCFIEPACRTDKPDHENWKVLPLVADRYRTQIPLLEHKQINKQKNKQKLAPHIAEESAVPRQLPAVQSSGVCLSYRGQPASRSCPCCSSPHSMIKLGSVKAQSFRLTRDILMAKFVPEYPLCWLTLCWTSITGQPLPLLCIASSQFLSQRLFPHKHLVGSPLENPNSKDLLWRTQPAAP